MKQFKKNSLEYTLVNYLDNNVETDEIIKKLRPERPECVKSILNEYKHKWEAGIQVKELIEELAEKLFTIE